MQDFISGISAFILTTNRCRSRSSLSVLFSAALAVSIISRFPRSISDWELVTSPVFIRLIFPFSFPFQLFAPFDLTHPHRKLSHKHHPSVFSNFHSSSAAFLNRRTSRIKETAGSWQLRGSFKLTNSFMSVNSTRDRAGRICYSSPMDLGKLRSFIYSLQAYLAFVVDFDRDSRTGMFVVS